MSKCITATATIKNRITVNTNIKSKISSIATAKLNTNSGPCPIILCIDGGAANTASYGPVNGLLNGGTA